MYVRYASFPPFFEGRMHRRKGEAFYSKATSLKKVAWYNGRTYLYEATTEREGREKGRCWRTDRGLRGVSSVFFFRRAPSKKEGGRKVHNFAVRVQVEEDAAKKKVGEEECKFLSAANLIRNGDFQFRVLRDSTPPPPLRPAVGRGRRGRR